MFSVTTVRSGWKRAEFHVAIKSNERKLGKERPILVGRKLRINMLVQNV
jgi:hypothetical protein